MEHNFMFYRREKKKKKPGQGRVTFASRKYIYMQNYTIHTEFSFIFLCLAFIFFMSEII